MALLKGFETPSEDDLRRLWNEGLFVLDTSILLNLHRYREKAREDFLGALDRIRERLWIPFHVALEYERNRAKVIAKQRANIRKARDKIESIPETVRSSLQETEIFRRHALGNVEELLQSLGDLSSRFCTQLDAAQSAAPEVHQPDNVRTRIEGILAGRVGSAPENQAQITALNEAAAARFARHQPPGYLDQPKDAGKDPGAFVYGGLLFELKYGDFYVWEQIKAWARNAQGKPICFLTDDQKEDWWWIVDSDGPKRLGPRPELKEEIHRECGVDLFHMYSPDAFLVGMNQFRDAQIDPASVTEAREVSQERRRRVSTVRVPHALASAAILEWLREKHKGDNSNFAKSFFPDLLRVSAENVVQTGYEAIPAAAGIDLVKFVADLSDSMEGFLSKFPGAELRLMFVFSTAKAAKDAFDQLDGSIGELPDRVMVCTGHLGSEAEYIHQGCFAQARLASQIVLK